MATTKKTLLLIDSFALIFRAYYAFPPTLTTAEGEPINAAYGFTSLMLEVLRKFKPTHVVAVFDPGGPIIRQTESVAYKANRKETDQALLLQIPRVREILETFDIPVLMVEGYEADDVIGTIDKRHSGKWAETIIVTGDQDLFQLVDEDTSVFLASRKFSESKLFKAEEVFQKLGIHPNQVIDYKSLRGDASDNIPGVKGIGEKTAVTLLQSYGSLNGIYENIGEIKGSVQTKLQDNYEEALQSHKLATIDQDVPISFDFNNASFDYFSIEKVLSLFKDLRFKSLEKKAKDLAADLGIKETPSAAEKQSNGAMAFDFSAVAEAELKEPKAFDFSKAKEVCVLGDYFNLDKSPIQWGISQLLFMLPGDKEVFKVKSKNLKDFIKAVHASKVKLITFDSKKLLHSLLNQEIDTDKLAIFDLGFATYLLAEGKINYSLEASLTYFGLDGNHDTSSEKAQRHNLSFFNEAYAESVKEFKEKTKLAKVFKLESDLLPVVVQMERNGIVLDKEILKTFEHKLTDLKEKVRQEIYKSAGHEFNINSPRQVGEILFQEKQLPGGKKTKSGQFSTDERTLNKLKSIDPMVQNILKFREMDKLLSTYIKTLPDYVDDDGRIHSVFDQLGAISGRFSSKNPNMQNIPPANEGLGVNVRESFVCAKDALLISFDYSQQELRILAAFSKEEELVKAFNSDQDIHKLTAAELFNVPLADVTPAQRQVGKTINFSVIYGISAFGLSERLEIERDLAFEFINKYYKKYSKVQGYFETMKNLARKQGYLETFLGRRRTAQGMQAANFAFRSAAERELLNFVIQGTAADIMKTAMLEIGEIVKKYPVKLLSQIHDEFLFEYETKKIDAKAEKFIAEVRECMLNAVDLGVKFKVDAKVGKNWGRMKGS